MGINMKNNIIREYFEEVKNAIGEDNLNEILSSDCRDEDGLFLSVIMRTQGKRISTLQEVLLCLQAQTCYDFEVLLLGHDVSSEDKLNIEKLIKSFPDNFRSKIKYHDVIGGTRTTPLNYGFDNANGRYISILDDDDLVFDNWVESFYEASKKHSGKILHAYAVGQDWKYNESGPVSFSSFNNVYCRDFIMNNQLMYNNCPIMSLAFPAYSFKKFNIRFDEILNTTEDWDFLMRTAFFCGVGDIDNATSIYRHWNNMQNSQSLHNEKEWKKNYRNIQRNFRKYAIPLKVSDILDYSLSVSPHSNLYEKMVSEAEIFIDNGNGFNSGNKAKFDMIFEDNNLKISIIEPHIYGKIKSLRFDPSNFGMIKLSEFDCIALDSNEKPIKFKVDFVNSNYVKNGKSYLFLEDDPQFKINFDYECDFSSVTFVFNIEEHLSWKLISFVTPKLVITKIIRKVAMFGKRFFR